MDQITINLPIYIDLGAKKKKSTFSLNLNTYRNAHYHILNKAKALFEELISKQIKHFPAMAKVELTYALFFGSRRAIDVANVCCIVDKFFCDTLVNCGKLPGDDKEIISKIVYDWGGIDTQNPHVKVTLSNIEMVHEDPVPMQISFSQTEIKDALLELLEKQISLQPGQAAVIEFDLENPKDIIAYVDIVRGNTTQTQTAVKAPAQQAAAPTPKPAKTPSKKAVEVPVEATQETTAVDEAAEVTQASAISTGEERVDTSQDEVVQDETVQEAATEEIAPVAATAASGIFPNAVSSAPALPATPAPTGKSLFANLMKPSNVPESKTVN
jgi:hypothetical protein